MPRSDAFDVFTVFIEFFLSHLFSLVFNNGFDERNVEPISPGADCLPSNKSV
jgi:hypothetical protein